jgi:hypothetical protein
MPLFPQLGAQYYDEKDRGVISRMEQFYGQALGINMSFWGEADLDTQFHAGNQTLWNNYYGNLSVGQRRQFNFNHIRRVVNMISGHQRRNRKSTIVTPIENADNMTADQFSKVMMWINQQEGVLETISESFEGALVTGMNFLQVWLDYRTDPVSGNIKVDNCSYNSFVVDPYFRKTDLSDCNGIWKRSYLTKTECVSLFPNNADEILNLPGSNHRDGKFQFMPENYNWDQQTMLTYDQFYYRDYRTQKMIIDSVTGESTEWRGSKEDLAKFLTIWPQVTVVESQVPTVKQALLVQGKVFYDGPHILGIDSYPFVPVLAYYAPQMPYLPWRIQGVVRGLRDSQYLYNRRKVIELDMLESQITSGWIYKENALVNPKDVFLSGQGRGLALKDEAQMTDVQQIQSPRIDPSLIALSESLGKEFQEISGVSEELLGSAVDDKAGILSMLRQSAGLTTLQGLFDQLDRSQKLLGKMMIDIIQANFMPGKIKRILEGEEPTAQFYNKAFGKYDAAVEEGLNTTTQKQMQFAQLLQLREVGVPIPDDTLLEACTVQDKKKLLESIEKSKQQQMQMQQQQMEGALQEQAARTNLANARATADQGLGIERLSRVQENNALAQERRAAAVKDQETGFLSLVKAVKELEHMDLAELEKLLSLSNNLNEVSQQNPEQAAREIQ